MDVDKLRLPESGWPFHAPEKPTRRQRQPKEFLRGPVPIAWLARAGSLRGKALEVALAIWFRVGCGGKRSDVRLSAQTLARFGVGRKAGYRALAVLESAGLISVRRRRGASPLVTVLDVADDTEGESCEG